MITVVKGCFIYGYLTTIESPRPQTGPTVQNAPLAKLAVSKTLKKFFISLSPFDDDLYPVERLVARDRIGARPDGAALAGDGRARDGRLLAARCR